MKNNIPSVSKALKQIRFERGITQHQLADILGISTSTACLWESGDRFPNKTMREKICNYFDVDMNFLCGFSKVHNSVVEDDRVMSINYFERKSLKNEVSSINLQYSKDIFDVTNTISTMMLPKTLFRKNASYFAIKCVEDKLAPYGISNNDIAIFMAANHDDIENNTIVCALIDGKVVIRSFIMGDEANCYYLANAWNDAKPQKVFTNNEEVILGKLSYVLGKR